MVTTVTTLAGVSAKLRGYLADSRPLNLDEMRNVADVVDSVLVPLERVALHLPDKAVGWQLWNDWNLVKVNMGERSRPR